MADTTTAATTAAATWTHKDVVITLSGAHFIFKFSASDKKWQSKSSLAAAKKAIDTWQTAKAKEVALEMAVVFWQGNSWRTSEKCEEGIGRATVTGLRQDLTPQGLPTWSTSWVMPDSLENEQLILDMKATKMRLAELEEEIGKRGLSFYFPDGRSKPSYDMAVKTLQQRWDEARTASRLGEK